MSIILNGNGTSNFSSNIANDGTVAFGSSTLNLDSSGNLGLGNTNPSDFRSGAENLVVGSGSGAEGITIYSANNASGRICFADGSGSSDEERGVVLYAHDDNHMQFNTDATERMRISSTGAIVLPDGSPGIQFGTTSTNNSNGVLASRTLDDYEEGTWTPTIAAQSGTFSINHTTQTGYYTKTGNIVTAYFNVSWNSFSNGTGNIMYIGTLPYLALSAAQVNGYITQIYGVDFTSWGGVTGGTSLSLQGYSGTRITTCAMKSGSTITDTRGRMSMLNATGTIRGTVIYNVS